MPGVDGDKVQLHLAFQRAIFKDQVAATQTQVVLDVLLYAGCLYMDVSGCFNHGADLVRSKTLRLAEKFSGLAKLVKCDLITVR